MRTMPNFTGEDLLDIYASFKSTEVSNQEIYRRVADIYDIKLTHHDEHIIRGKQHYLKELGKLVNVARGYWALSSKYHEELQTY